MLLKAEAAMQYGKELPGLRPTAGPIGSRPLFAANFSMTGTVLGWAGILLERMQTIALPRPR